MPPSTPSNGSLNAYIALPHGLSSASWERRHLRDEVPDRAPYGLHRLANYGVTPTFGSVEFGRHMDRIAGQIRYRTGDLELLELLKERSPSRRSDVVFCYDERNGFPAALAAGVRLSAPVVTGVGWLGEPAHTQPLQRRLARYVLPRAAAVFSQSFPQAELLNTAWGVPPSRLFYVPVGIDTDFYRLQPWEPQSPAVVVSAGEDQNRDHRLLIDAVGIARERCSGLTLELATALPVDARDGLVTLHTERLNGRMRDLYRRCTVVAIAVRPNVITGSGLTVALEAMSSGRPVVMTDNPGISHYIRHGIDGLLVPPGDPVAFAEAILELANDPQRAQSMGEAGAQRARAEFSSEHMAEHFARIMHGI